MGARHSRDSRSDSDDDSSSVDSSSDAGGSTDRNEHPNIWQRISTCFKPDSEDLAFRTATDVKTAAKPKKQIPLKALTVENKGKKVEEYFDLDKNSNLGEGGYARVVLGKDKRGGASYAVKIITKSRVAMDQRLRNEIDLMLSLDHPNIVKLFQTFEDQRAIYLVLELCAGGELFDKVVETGHLSEKITADIMQQVFRAVHYMHGTVHIAHRDLKPENFMFQNKGGLEGNTLKVIDFGIAAIFKDLDEPKFSTKTGTPFYVAPEVLGRNPAYGPQVDMWSCGVIMYVLLSGRLPFKGMDENATLQKVQVGKFQFGEAFDQVSKEAKDLIKRLLTKSPQARATAEQALNDIWTKKVGPSPGNAPVQLNVVNAIREFNTQNKMKRTALRLVARQLNEGAIANLRKLFTQLDKDGNGTLTVDELREGLRNANLPPQVVETIIQGVDSDKSGEIDYSEFIAATLERREYLTESACWAAFRVFDRDGDGRITKKELGDVLGSYELVQELNIQNHDVEDLMAEVDTNKDGVIDFTEFMQMMKR